jgi:hypothetical protein
MSNKEITKPQKRKPEMPGQGKKTPQGPSAKVIKQIEVMTGPSTKKRGPQTIKQERQLPLSENRAIHLITRFKNGFPVPPEELINSMKSLNLTEIDNEEFTLTLKEE